MTALPLAAPPQPARAPAVPPDSVPPAQIINTYTEAVQTVDPFKATGKPHTLWVAFAKFYEDNGQLDDVSAVPFVHLCVCVCTDASVARGRWRHRHGHVCMSVYTCTLMAWGGGRVSACPLCTLAGPHHPGEGHQGELQAGG